MVSDQLFFIYIFGILRLLPPSLILSAFFVDSIIRILIQDSRLQCGNVPIELLQLCRERVAQLNNAILALELSVETDGSMKPQSSIRQSGGGGNVVVGMFGYRSRPATVNGGRVNVRVG